MRVLMPKIKKLFIFKQIPRSIWVLGLVSLFMDSSSELIHSLLPLFMVSVLHADMTTIGVIEGIAESAALISKVFSGFLSDYFGQRKWIAVIGYGIAALSKPLFPLANSLGLVFTARLIDRLGKGIRGAPRDALIGDLAPKEIRGTCYGLRQSLDTVGAIIGPLLAMFLMYYFNGNMRSCFWIAVIPAFIAVAILIAGVKEPKQRLPSEKKTSMKLKEIKLAPSGYWYLVAIGGVLALARFSEAFLLLKIKSIGVPLQFIPLALILMNAAYALSSYPAGRLADLIPRKTVLIIGVGLLLGADLLLSFTQSVKLSLLSIVLWGLHMGFSQGLLATMIADAAPAKIRGTAFGIFNLFSGIAMLLASVIAGILWDLAGAKATFLAGAGFSAIVLMMLIPYQISQDSALRR